MAVSKNTGVAPSEEIRPPWPAEAVMVLSISSPAVLYTAVCVVLKAVPAPEDRMPM